MRKAVFQVNEGFQNEDGGIEMPASISTRRWVDDDASTAYVEREVLVGEKTKKYPFYAAVSYGADFRWKPGTFDGERLERLLSQNAPALLLGYVRVAIATLTNFSPYPSYNLPFVDLTKEMQQNSWAQKGRCCIFRQCPALSHYIS